MKKKFIEAATKWVYTWPAWTAVILSIATAFRFYGAVGMLLYFSPVILASALFAIGRWQGVFPGIVFGLLPMAEYLYEEYLVSVKGAIIYHRLNPLPFTLAVAAYYIFMGWRVYQLSKGQDRLFDVNTADNSPVKNLDLTK